MIKKFRADHYIEYKKLYNDIKHYSKNDLPAFYNIYTYHWITVNNYCHRDNDLPDHINIFRFIANFTFSKYELYYRYNGYGYVNQYNKNGNISKTENYKFINGICCERLKMELNQ